MKVLQNHFVLLGSFEMKDTYTLPILGKKSAWD